MDPHWIDFSPLSSLKWGMGWVSGSRMRKESLDTLKKLLKSPPRETKSHAHGFVQVLPLRCVGSPEHLSWAGLSVVQALESNTLHFRQPELEFLARVSGTFQWKDVQSIASLKDSDMDVVVVWMGPSKEWDEKSFVSACKEWGLKPRARPPFPAEEKAIALIEKSALAGLE